MIEVPPRVSSLFACLSVASVAAGHADALGAVAEIFSPRYECLRGGLVVVDLRGVDRLFGAPRAVGEAIQREAAVRQVPVHIAVAATQAAAVVMAISRPGLTVVPTGEEAAALAGIPLGVLTQIGSVDFGQPQRASRSKPVLDAAGAVALFARWGLRTLGELAVLPPADVNARLGVTGRVWQQLARGVDARPLVPARAEERFEGVMELEWPIEGLEPLSFVLTRLLEPLSTRLERADRGAAALHLHLRLITREDYVRSVELPSPMREVRALRTLLLLDLESHPPSAAIDRVTVTIDPTPARILQHTLFARPHPTPEQLSTLLARLGALLGQNRVGAAHAANSHRPGAFEMKAFQPPAPDLHPATSNRESQAASNLQPSSSLVSALRRYRQPVPARVVTSEEGRPVRVTTDRRGLSGGAVLSCAGPWRTSGEWWNDPEPHSPVIEPRFGNVDPRVPPEVAALTHAASQAMPDKRPPSLERPHAKTDDVAPKLASESMRAKAEPAAPKLAPESMRAKAEPAAPKLASESMRAKAGWDRDEWDVALSDGVLYRVFQDRTTRAWFIEAVVD